MAKRINRTERILSKITITDNGCWEWIASQYLTGYGKFTEKIDGRFITTSAHRTVYQLFKIIPNGLTLDHLCRNRLCTNPEHLEPVTLRENIRRGMAYRNWEQSGRYNAMKTHCKNGHSFTATNTYIHPSRGTRDCKKCKYIRNREIALRKKEQLCHV